MDTMEAKKMLEEQLGAMKAVRDKAREDERHWVGLEHCKERKDRVARLHAPRLERLDKTILELESALRQIKALMSGA